MPGCPDCPEPVISVLRRRIYYALYKLRATKHLTTVFNRAYSDAASNAAGDVSTLASLIPLPSPFNAGEVVNWLLCPLTPVALAEVALDSAEKLDPKVLLQKFKRFIPPYVEELERVYDSDLRKLDSAGILILARRYIQELRRFAFEQSDLVRATAITTIVRTTPGCETIYQNGPFAEFEREALTFAFDGLLPSTLDSRVRGLMVALATGETRLASWRSLSVPGI